jgi:uncharacterized protein YegP (UPF0339 family)
MKIHKKDQYDWSVVSPSGRPGFEVFHHNAQEAWLFVCNDVHGLPMLFSQLYQQRETAQKGVESVLKNLAKNTPLQQVMEQWQFVVVAGNKQEVAASRLFDTQADCEQALLYVRQVAKSKNPIALPLSPTPDAAVAEPTPAHGPLRHAFRLYFYQNETGDYIGRIEDMSDRRQQSFDGLDLNVLQQFLAQSLSMAQPTSAATGIPLNKAISAELNLNHHSNQASTPFRLLTKSEQLNMALKAVSPHQLTPEMSLLGTQITLYQEGTQITHQLPTQAASFEPDRNQITIATQADGDLATGTYQIRAESWIKAPTGIATMQAEAVIHIV